MTNNRVVSFVPPPVHRQLEALTSRKSKKVLFVEGENVSFGERIEVVSQSKSRLTMTLLEIGEVSTLQRQAKALWLIEPGRIGLHLQRP
jgi:hypothetical protein